MLFIQKKCNVQQRLFVTYLYVYVYNTISDDINSKFLKSPNPHAWCGFGNGMESICTVLKCNSNTIK